MKLRRILSCMMALLLVCSLPLAAFADTYDLANGNVSIEAKADGQYVTQGETSKNDNTPVITQSNNETSTTNTVTITAAENTTANVTLQDVNIVIGGGIDGNGKAAVTIEAADKASANVTLSGVDIDVSETGYLPELSGYAAVQIIGDGDVTLELDGVNTALGGFCRAGVEKDDANGSGTLTITDSSGTGGSLTATGGAEASGIGGGRPEGGYGFDTDLSGNASNITISGSAEVNATGGASGAGIGGGSMGSGSGITITGSAKVTASAGDGGMGGSSGIGGGREGSGSGITIEGSAEVSATGSRGGAGIGGGINGTGSVIAISQNATVKVQGGEGIETDGTGTGAAIGGGAMGIDGEYISGAEVPPGTDKLTSNGTIEYYAPGADMETDVPYKTVVGTYGSSEPTEPVQPAEPEEDASQPAPAFRLKGQDGKGLTGRTERKGGVLTITVDADCASLTGYLSDLQTLRGQGIDTIVFVTNGATSTFALADLMATMTAGDSYTLTHDGESVTFTLGNGTDISSILNNASGAVINRPFGVRWGGRLIIAPTGFVRLRRRGGY